MKISILIVDDEADVRETWELTLRMAGFGVTTAGSASAALELAEQQAFDVVILDFIIPGMTGLELLVRIRERIPYIRSVIVSGKLNSSTSASEITENLKASIEADVFLHKPCTNDDLVAAVSDLMSRHDDSTWEQIAQHAIKAARPRLKDARESSAALKRSRKK